MKNVLTLLFLALTLTLYGQSTFKIVPATNTLQPRLTQEGLHKQDSVIYSAQLYQSIPNALTISAVDLNVDNSLDLMVTSRSTRLDSTALFNEGDSLATYNISHLQIIDTSTTGINGRIDNLGRSTPYWIDYNKDGLLDLFIKSDSTSVLELYRANADTSGFTYVKDILSGHSGLYGVVIPGDINDDGTVDFVGSVRSLTHPYDYHSFIIYFDTSGNYTVDTLTLEDSLSTGHNGSGFIRDLNGDGLKDIVLFTGEHKSRSYQGFDMDTTQTQIYIQDSLGQFTPRVHNLPRTYNNRFFEGHFDTIQGVDGVVFGSNTAFNIDSFYTGNQLYTFTTYQIDFDNITVTNDSAIFNITNYNDTALVDQPIWELSFYHQVADITNDGLSDIAFAGNAIFVSSVNGGFTRNMAVFEKNGVQHTPRSMKFGDFNDDGLIDVSAYVGDSTIILIQDSDSVNTSPLKIGVVNSSNIDGRFNLSWVPPYDAETKSSNLTYNVRIGTTPGGSQVLAPKSNVVTGFNKVAENGSLSETSVSISGLPTGTYYYSVQAVDAGYRTSEWSQEKTFSISIVEEKIVAYPNPTTDNVNLIFDSFGEKSINVYNMGGQLINSTSTYSNETSIDLTSQPSGVYVIHVVYNGRVGTVKVVKN